MGILSHLVVNIKRFILEIISTIIVALATLFSRLYFPSYENFFVERDPSFSCPYHHGPLESVPNWLVILLAIPVSMAIIAAIQLFFRYFLLKKYDYIAPRAINHFLSQLAFLEAVFMTLFITEFLKSYIGRKRPNFYAYCNYKGYRDALESGNFTSYFELTVPGAPGSLSYCYDQDPHVLKDSQASFPSGHSSSIFCGFSFVGMFVLYLFHQLAPKEKNFLKLMVAYAFTFLALVVGGTRSRDYWHNYDDVVAGAIIGFSCAFFSMTLNYFIHTKKAKEMVNELDRDDYTSLVGN